jgi:hypothetical protein
MKGEADFYLGAKIILWHKILKAGIRDKPLKSKMKEIVYGPHWLIEGICLLQGIF